MMRIKMGISWTNRARDPCRQKATNEIHYITVVLEKREKKKQYFLDLLTRGHCLRLSVAPFFLACYDVQSAFFHFCKHAHYLKKK